MEMMTDPLGFRHTLLSEDLEFYDVERFFYLVGRQVKDQTRRWWQHPRWHVRHWQLQIHPINTLKRWLFSRCCRCGKRFSWGYSPVTGQWNNPGPGWFTGEENVYHSDCDSPELDQVQEASP